MSDSQRDLVPNVKLPGPDDDATPFMLRCYVKAYPFRPLQEFGLMPKQDEFKLYVWRSASLRDIANILHMRDPSLSTATSSHSFRIIQLDPDSRVYTAREAGAGVTRISRAVFEDIVSDVISQHEEKEKERDDKDAQSQSSTFEKIVSRVRPKFPDDADEEAALITLNDLNFIEGDSLDCVIKGSPALSSSISVKRSRMESIGNHYHSQGREAYRDWDRDRHRHPDEFGTRVVDRRQRY